MKRVGQRRSLIGLIAVPILLLMSLFAWATVVAPYGEPDSDYHLSSMYCSQGFEDGLCEPGKSEGYRLVRGDGAREICYRNDPDVGAACIGEALADHELIETGNGNFRGAYPDVYYTVQHFTVGDDAEITFRDARFLNATLVTLGLGLLTALIRPERRRALWYAVAGSLVPLGLFTIASINPSAWAIFGPLFIFVAAASVFEAEAWRRWALIALTVVALVVVAGTRTDAGAFGLFAALAAILVAGHFSKRMVLAIGVPALVALAVVGALMAGTGRFRAYANLGLFTDFFGTLAGRPGEGQTRSQIIQNALEVPHIWMGAFGTWDLGWFDVPLPYIVPAFGIVAFGAIVFFGLRKVNWREAIALIGVVILLFLVPLLVLFSRNQIVGDFVQPRYILPLLALGLGILLWRGAGTMTTLQRWFLIGLLATSNMFALRSTMNRYILDSSGGPMWWPSWAPPSSLVFLCGTLAFAGFLVGVFYLFERPVLSESSVPAPAQGAEGALAAGDEDSLVAEGELATDAGGAPAAVDEGVVTSAESEREDRNLPGRGALVVPGRILR